MLMQAHGHNNNQKARLLSPMTISKVPMCMTFYYYMYGTGVNKLSIYTKSNGRISGALWSKRGNQGAAWNVGQVTLRTRNRNYQVKLRVIFTVGFHFLLKIKRYQFYYFSPLYGHIIRLNSVLTPHIKDTLVNQLN